jgi:hypothetical protein
MKNISKKNKLMYETPKAVSLSGVAQGACTLGSAFTAARCKAGLSAGGNCQFGANADSDCKSGTSVVGNCKVGTNP